MREISSSYLSDPSATTFTEGPPHTWPEVKEVIAHCDTVWDHNTRLRHSGDPRVRVVVERFSEGHTVEELKTAISGSGRDPWIKEHPKLQSVLTLLKDSAAVDQYARQLQDDAAEVPRVQPSSDWSGYQEMDSSGGGGAQEAFSPPDDPFDDEGVADA